MPAGQRNNGRILLALHLGIKVGGTVHHRHLHRDAEHLVQLILDGLSQGGSQIAGLGSNLDIGRGGTGLVIIGLQMLLGQIRVVIKSAVHVVRAGGREGRGSQGIAGAAVGGHQRLHINGIRNGQAEVLILVVIQVLGVKGQSLHALHGHHFTGPGSQTILHGVNILALAQVTDAHAAVLIVQESGCLVSNALDGDLVVLDIVCIPVIGVLDVHHVIAGGPIFNGVRTRAEDVGRFLLLVGAVLRPLLADDSNAGNIGQRSVGQRSEADLDRILINGHCPLQINGGCVGTRVGCRGLDGAHNILRRQRGSISKHESLTQVGNDDQVLLVQLIALGQIRREGIVCLNAPQEAISGVCQQVAALAAAHYKGVQAGRLAIHVQHNFGSLSLGAFRICRCGCRGWKIPRRRRH